MYWPDGYSGLNTSNPRRASCAPLLIVCEPVSHGADLRAEIRPEHDRIAQHGRQAVVRARSELTVDAGVRVGDADSGGRVPAVALTERCEEALASEIVIDAHDERRSLARARTLAYEVL